MFKIAILSSLVLLSGCTVYNDRSIPSALTIMPRDCANERGILGSYDRSLTQERGMLTDEVVYEQYQRFFKYQKWRLKHKCNLVN